MNFRNRYLLFSCTLAILAGCTSDFKNLTRTDSTPCSLEQFKPVFEYEVYTAKIDVIDKHLSGLLVLKTMPDKSIRAVFQSEMGLTYFDFEWTENGAFEAKYVVKQMDKQVVITALRKDFELMLMNRLDTTKAITFTDGVQMYTRMTDESDFIYAITDTSCSVLAKMERASKRKAKVDMYLNATHRIPDSVLIEHKQFKFTISLSRILQ